MNLDALPYTSFIVLVEFAVGSLIVCVYADWRGRVEPSFVKFCAAMVAVGALVMVGNAAILDPDAAGGFHLDDDLATPVLLLSAVFAASTLPYNWAVMRENRQQSLVTGLISAAIGLVLIVAVSIYIALPTWGFAGVF